MSNNIFIPDRASENIYHFFIYMIANLRNIDYIPDTIYINLKKHFFKDRHNYIMEILTLLYPNTTITDSNICPIGCISLKQSPEPVSREAGVSPEEYKFLQHLFVPILQKYTPTRTYSKYIYISRLRDSNKRRILNEDSIINKDTLSEFQHITMLGLPIIEQMYIVYNAKVVVSAHGAALMNILFCNTSTTIIEISTTKMSNLKHFQHIAEVLQLNYMRYTDVEACSPNSYDSDIIIKNIQSFISLLKTTIVSL